MSKIGVRDHQKGGSDRKPTRSSGTIWTTARAPGPLDWFGGGVMSETHTACPFFFSTPPEGKKKKKEILGSPSKPRWHRGAPQPSWLGPQWTLSPPHLLGKMLPKLRQGGCESQVGPVRLWITVDQDWMQAPKGPDGPREAAEPCSFRGVENPSWARWAKMACGKKSLRDDREANWAQWGFG